MISWNEQPPDFRRQPITDLLPRLSFTAACAIMVRPEQTQVIASRPVLEAIWLHLLERNIEMGGLLIGAVHDLDLSGSRFVVSLQDFAQADSFAGTGVSLRMDTAVWEAARARLQDGCSVIGWYHSHPDLGAFFSGTDRRTQNAFFSLPHCLGLVIDPVRREEKWFLGPGCFPRAGQQIIRID